jgi:hypothetical protein
VQNITSRFQSMTQAPVLGVVSPCNSTYGVATLPCNPSGGAILIAWHDPLNTGGIPVLRWTLAVDGTVVYVGSNPFFHVMGLAGNTQYCFSVAATNFVGEGNFGPCGLYRTAVNTKPGSPGGLTIVNATGDSVCFAWNASTDNGACNPRVCVMLFIMRG